MKILYLKGYKWLLSQNQQVRNDFLVTDGIRHWLSIPNLVYDSIHFDNAVELRKTSGLFFEIFM